MVRRAVAEPGLGYKRVMHGHDSNRSTDDAKTLDVTTTLVDLMSKRS